MMMMRMNICVYLMKNVFLWRRSVFTVYLMIMMGPAHRQIPLNASPQDEENWCTHCHSEGKKDNCKPLIWNEQKDSFIINHSNRGGSPVEGVLETGIDVKEMVWIPFGWKWKWRSGYLLYESECFKCIELSGYQRGKLTRVVSNMANKMWPL